MSIFAAVMRVIRIVNKTYKEQQDQTKSLIEADRRLDVIESEADIRRDANLALLHDRIYSECERILGVGAITVAEMNNLEHLFDAYKSLGDNGTAEALYNRVRGLL